nr:NADH dehydrogenase subunit 5 [Halipeurus diversus]
MYLFLLTVMFVGFCVINYSRCYMNGDSMSKKFFITIFLFIMSMLILSSSANLVWLMIGWDGLGLTSFFLIVYFQNSTSLNNSMVTFISNRIGDLFMIMSIMWMINLYSMSTSNCFKMNFIVMVFSIVMLLGALSKSAQVPFSAWLPLAMAAPTPVSALVHSSTLVTAGVFLMIRFYPIINSELFMIMLTYFSYVSLILSSTSALWEFDLKKIIALSTLSHIGFMMMFIATGNLSAALIHMVMHALFKSLLFMCAGVMIHSGFDLQDIRKMHLPSSLKHKISSSFIISILSMMGTPFLSGYYSKDFMVLTCLNFYMNMFSFFVVFTSVMLSCAYSVRLMFYVFGNFSSCESFTIKESETLNEMEMSMFIMSISSSIMGGMFINLIVDMDIVQFSYNEPFMKIFLLIFMMLGIFLGISLNNMKLNYNLLSFNIMCMKMWFVGWIYMPFQKIFFYNSNIMFNYNDIKGWLDDFMVMNFNKDLENLFKVFTKIMMNMFSFNKIFMLTTLNFLIIMLMFLSVN